MEFNPTEIKLVVGLGNKDKKYAFTYHNAGSSAVLFLANQDNKPFKKPFLKPFFLVKGPNLSFAYLDCYMNESGGPLKKLLNYLNISPAELLVLHDDSDLPIGEFKLAFGSSSAGHHGIDSSIKYLGSENFWRLRIGIRGPENINRKAGDFVLSKISPSDSEGLEKVYMEIRKLLGLNR
jgi:PTH1 family peptidyl-tRNA hydrolase